MYSSTHHQAFDEPARHQWHILGSTPRPSDHTGLCSTLCSDKPWGVECPKLVGGDGTCLGLSNGTSFISSDVPSGSGAFQMPTCPSSSAASTLRGGRANLRNASDSVTFSLFWHEASLG